MKEVFGDNAPSYNVVKYWHCQTSVETAPIPGQPYSTIVDDTIHKVEAAILEDHCLTIQQLAQEVKISVGSVEKIINHYLYMQKLFARWIPQMLTLFQKQE
ncbi:uncharacterized protein LOC106879307 [Octopus bimaculoides]|uniref:uncharacterized protein LOC106879307 n=1 Tax=Octopus bimaculoides TaxID=37653 RepID=UPI00071E143C|nr:uncharacterized protein LOC106879307 [Octopus bimaculoides]|eukprot:XP_014784335.1 PREDICTED: uncharacterized protein LOC106879307 [Octopus bimaculoides]